jgi:Tfp pilus assembly protein PilN
MKADLRIDFIGPRRRPAAGMLLAGLASLAFAWQAQQAYADFDLLQRQRVGLAGLQRQAAAPLAPTMSPADIKRHAQIEALARQLATPWEDLLALFEQRVPSKVVLMKFEPDAAEGRLEITGRAPDARRLGEYLVALESDPRLGDVMLHHHEVLRADAGGSVEFTLGASWGRAAPVLPAAASVPSFGRAASATDVASTAFRGSGASGVASNGGASAAPAAPRVAGVRP